MRVRERLRKTEIERERKRLRKRERVRESEILGEKGRGCEIKGEIEKKRESERD